MITNTDIQTAETFLMPAVATGQITRTCVAKMLSILRCEIKPHQQQGVSQTSKTVDIDDYVSIPDASTLVKVSKSTINRWINKGWISAYGHGRNRKVKKSELFAVAPQSHTAA